MSSINSHTIKSEIFDITSSNLEDKFSDHFGRIIHVVKVLKFENLRMTTKIEETSPKEAFLSTDIIEQVKRMTKKK